ncbi:MAG: hypothetical protein N2045_09660 [Fimbriimonadales bacterium]|nr:hypothetical protein [Fimbriimonadales bacterium]
MRFYSVKDRKMVEVPDSKVKALRYERMTRSGKKRVRYALQAEYAGRKLYKFVDEATYRRFVQLEGDLGSVEDILARYEARVGEVLREAAAQRGLDWDQMSDEERTAFVAEWIDD